MVLAQLANHETEELSGLAVVDTAILAEWRKTYSEASCANNVANYLYDVEEKPGRFSGDPP